MNVFLSDRSTCFGSYEIRMRECGLSSSPYVPRKVKQHLCCVIRSSDELHIVCFAPSVDRFTKRYVCMWVLITLVMYRVFYIPWFVTRYFNIRNISFFCDIYKSDMFALFGRVEFVISWLLYSFCVGRISWMIFG